MKRSIFAIAFALLFSANSFAQEVSLGTDVVSRYVWRGTDFGNAVSFQPALSVAIADLEIGTWASYSIAGSGADEHDLYLSYGIGDVTLSVTDYYFPAGADTKGKFGLLNFDADGKGAHLPEVSASYSNEDNGLSLLVGSFIYNDVDSKGEGQNSTYVEVGYAAGSVNLFVGLGNGFYSLDGDFAPVNIGVSTSEEIKVTDSFSIPLFVQLIFNPDAERSHLVVGFSFILNFYYHRRLQ